MVIAKNGPSLYLGPFRVQLTRFDKIVHFDRKIANKRRTQSALRAMSGKIFVKKSVLTGFIPKKLVARTVVGSINIIDQKII